ncbi:MULTISPECIES: AI-2E family transporter [Pseudonocardia]|uniref:Predicted PurR-regulated permease PerM n=1 Tax=Pseudonocardia oroxyli TaxID=366584 RepID=A0A1G7LK48_PSEOR|nr:MULTISPECIES: AI-2E family transporter [Pseudonocardia]MCF7551984.1 AI-2E family transporter [Pseudonocardia sp. WMMC193]SDF49912.1 Predicted PurR-regulated permease PerM [Pseudonocardia oroxyli]
MSDDPGPLPPDRTPPAVPARGPHHASPGAEPAPRAEDREERAAAAIPTPLRVISEICARSLVIAAAFGLLIFLVIQLRIVVVPVAIAVLLSALLAPLVQLLTRNRVPRGVAVALTMLGGLAVIGGLLSFVVNTFIGGFPDLQRQLTASLQAVQEFLAGAPFNLSSEQLRNLPGQIGQAITSGQETLTTGVLTTAATITELGAGIALAIFTLIFVLYDGARIWGFLLKATPRHRRDKIDVAGRRAFATLVGYTRATILVAFVDAIGIGIGLWAVGVPLVVPLAALVFLGAFIPTVGAVVSGVVAVLIALVANGLIPAVIILAVVIGVQQLEGHVLQPLLLGRAVKLHPLAVVLAVAAGVVIAGIPGALLAVPLLAVVSAAVRSWVRTDEPPAYAVNPVDPHEGNPDVAQRIRVPSWWTRLFRRLAADRR